MDGLAYGCRRTVPYMITNTNTNCSNMSIIVFTINREDGADETEVDTDDIILRQNSILLKRLLDHLPQRFRLQANSSNTLFIHLLLTSLSIYLSAYSFSFIYLLIICMFISLFGDISHVLT